MKNEELPAWMTCGELLARLKDELIIEATEVLHKEIEAKRISFNGRLITLPESSGEMEHDLYMINKLVEQENDIRARYERDIAKYDAGSIKDPGIVENIEELKKFLMALTLISMLVHYSTALGSASERAGRYVDVDERSDIIRRVIGEDEKACEALQFVLDNKTIKQEKVISEEERVALRKAIS